MLQRGKEVIESSYVSLRYMFSRMKRDRKGALEIEEIVKIVFFIIILVIVVIGFIALFLGRGSSLMSSIKNIFTFGS
jgi:heme/copper-type cytochrome/quinol oxidase subunit 4